MDCTEGAVAVFDLCNDEELVALTHGCVDTAGSVHVQWQWQWQWEDRRKRYQGRKLESSGRLRKEVRRGKSTGNSPLLLRLTG